MRRINDIKTTLCSFEVSERLWMASARLETTDFYGFVRNHPNGAGWYLNIKSGHTFPCPTVDQALNWLYKNYGIHIWTEATFNFRELRFQSYWFRYGETKPLTGDLGGFVSYKDKDEATMAMLVRILVLIERQEILWGQADNS